MSLRSSLCWQSIWGCGLNIGWEETGRLSIMEAYELLNWAGEQSKKDWQTLSNALNTKR